MKMKKLAILIMAGAMVFSMAACKSDDVTEISGTAEEDSESEALETEGIAGAYSFLETVNFGNETFETPWTLTLNEDGSYELVAEAMVAVRVTGTYTVEDETTVFTSAPNESDFNILADFFEEDYSCYWIIDVDQKTMTPVNYSGATEGVIEGESGADVLTPAYSDVAYASVSESDICDIYLPEGEGDFPVLLLVHGGGFKFGDKNMDIIRPVIAAGVEHGYAVISVDYRKSGEAVFPAAAADVKAAVRFVRAEAETYGFDTDKIAIWGESAGAYLSLMTALTPEVSELDGDVTDYAEYSSDVDALVTFYAPVEFYTMRSEYESWGDTNSGNGSFESDFLGVADIYADKDACDKSYWETYKEQIPENFELAAWIQVGDENDTSVPYTQSVNFADRLNGVSGVKVEFSQLEGAGHEDVAFYTEENLSAVFEFLAQNL